LINKKQILPFSDVASHASFRSQLYYFLFIKGFYITR
jgi:hypothetical protein